MVGMDNCFVEDNQLGKAVVRFVEHRMVVEGKVVGRVVEVRN
jgi:hypothetical protein